MSIEDELLNLARLCRSQARLTKDRAAKQSLRKLGDHYEGEAQRLQEQHSADLQKSDWVTKSEAIRSIRKLAG